MAKHDERKRDDSTDRAPTSTEQSVDVALIGAGIMSATLGALLSELEPNWSVALYERLNAAAAESSDPWNNAGTGHSALCELNYTPQQPDGSVAVDKAVEINERFQVSRQYWAYAVDKGILSNPKDFINPIPHMSFVHGEDSVKYLRARYDALASQTLFEGMEYTEDKHAFSEWVPLMAQGRDFSDPVALNRFDLGTDVDFGALTRQLLTYLGTAGCDIRFGHEVRDVRKENDGRWKLTIRNIRTGDKRIVRARFVFVGAGGGALSLLQKSGIKEIKGFGGFPVSGQFLRCTNPDLIAAHNAKVYGKAAVGAPPMSVPHLDTRVIGGNRGLLFGPYAGWTPKFLKEGHLSDLFLSVKPNNVFQMMSVGLHEMGLTKYLVEQVLQSNDTRIGALAEFVPEAEASDWELITAGQRVQMIRPGKETKGTLELGTAIVAAEDGTIAGLLGASPGASTCVSAMLEVLERCFGDRYQKWEKDLQGAIPSIGQSLNENASLYREVWDHSNKVLKLTTQEDTVPAVPEDAEPAT
ncbi:malate dehydrogenase (quinone) [Hoyosella subflava]|uniref:Probable malate:quinone oxidoreductase n=1 Tax=Hoyosella subflava (strain DSM 45089 / JCM 17490 / NBRC 109087 / DQS3-9A1) TaxID=443218 RepID=F6EIZ6_HOYSD|nr:malate dehydrogenase (quinone) [Hoyosella subflava]AEF40057.1 putative malate:quinone oxidoreductase [Hoyosella subflava DQS3-9A1]